MALEQVGLAITITCKAVYQMWSGSLTVPGKLKCTAASLAMAQPQQQSPSIRGR